jgi:hypothetical protein
MVTTPAPVKSATGPPPSSHSHRSDLEEWDAGNDPRTPAARRWVEREESAVPDGERPGDDDGGLIQSREDGQLHFLPGTEDLAFPVTAPENATPLEEDEPEGTIPASPLWAMKERRHEQLLHLFGHPHRIRERIGDDDAAVYVMDDGTRHCMIGRRVGATVDGCVYSLIARVPKDTYESLAQGSIDGRQAFLSATEAGLSGTVEEPGVANVFDVDYYQHTDEIPAEYLPPGPFIEFAQDLPTADR